MSRAPGVSSWKTCEAKRGSRLRVRNPCAIVVPNGPAAAASTSTWIHWWSSVASAKASIRAWSISSHSLVPISDPAAAATSSSVVKVRMGPNIVLGRGRACLDVPMTHSLPRPGAPRAQGAAARPPRRRAAARRRSSSSPRRSATSSRPPTPSRSAAGSRESADSGSLVRYLETFDHTVAVMQNGPAITRVARECVEDLAADGVVYAEVRYAPEQHVTGGLTLDEVVGGGAGGLRRRGGRERRQDRRTPAADRDAAPGPVDGDRRARDRLARPRGRRLRHRRAPRRASRPPGTSTPSSTSSARTRTSPSTPARPSGCRRSGRRSSGAAPTGSATACGSSTTSRSTTTGRSSSAGSRPTSATCGSRSRCARAPTSRPARPSRSPSTRSGC